MFKTKIMGIVNVTPNSFYLPSRTKSVDAAIERALMLEADGADIIDIGGESTRPGAIPVPLEEELERVIPVIKVLSRELKIPISIDTKKPEVAEQAVIHGAKMLNDVSGFIDPSMRKIAADAQLDVCVMHMQGTPSTMQLQPVYERGVVVEVLEWLDLQAQLLIHDGIEPSRIILDPGIGFGKTYEDNCALIRNAGLFQKLGFRLLYGTSRKAFIRHFLNKPTEELLSATLAVNCLLALSGVEIIRVHDVKEHRDAMDILEYVTHE